MLAVFCATAIALTADLPGEVEFRRAAARLTELIESVRTEREKAELAASRMDKLIDVLRGELNADKCASLTVELDKQRAERAAALERMATFAGQAEESRAEMVKREMARGR